MFDYYSLRETKVQRWHELSITRWQESKPFIFQLNSISNILYFLYANIVFWFFWVFFIFLSQYLPEVWPDDLKGHFQPKWFYEILEKEACSVSQKGGGHSSSSLCVLACNEEYWGSGNLWGQKINLKLNEACLDWNTQQHKTRCQNMSWHWIFVLNAAMKDDSLSTGLFLNT